MCGECGWEMWEVLRMSPFSINPQPNLCAVGLCLFPYQVHELADKYKQEMGEGSGFGIKACKGIPEGVGWGNARGS